MYKELCAASFAGRLDVVQTLLRGGVSPSGRDASGLTALARASIGGHAAVASALIAAGADVNERDAHGDTPLHYAAFSGSESTVRVLLGAGAHAGALGADGRTPLASAAEAGHVAIVSVLVGAAAASPGAGGGQRGKHRSWAPLRCVRLGPRCCHRVLPRAAVAAAAPCLPLEELLLHLQKSFYPLEGWCVPLLGLHPLPLER